MSRARQNLGKRMRHVGLRHGYVDIDNERGQTRSTWGPEWERLRERRGMEPGSWYERRDVAMWLGLNSIYGKLAGGDEEACVSSDDVTGVSS